MGVLIVNSEGYLIDSCHWTEDARRRGRWASTSRPSTGDAIRFMRAFLTSAGFPSTPVSSGGI